MLYVLGLGDAKSTDGVVKEKRLWLLPLSCLPNDEYTAWVVHECQWLSVGTTRVLQLFPTSHSNSQGKEHNHWLASFLMHDFLLNTARWNSGTPGIPPGSSDSTCFSPRLWTDHETPPAETIDGIFPVFSCKADYCSCQWGRNKGTFIQTHTNSLRPNTSYVHAKLKITLFRL